MSIIQVYRIGNRTLVHNHYIWAHVFQFCRWASITTIYLAIWRLSSITKIIEIIKEICRADAPSNTMEDIMVRPSVHSKWMTEGPSPTWARSDLESRLECDSTRWTFRPTFPISKESELTRWSDKFCTRSSRQVIRIDRESCTKSVHCVDRY